VTAVDATVVIRAVACRLGPALVLILLGAAAGGCGRPVARPPDRAEAVAVLRAALDAWRRGDRPESLQQRQPPIRVADPAWSQGTRLTRFEIEEDQARPSGFDLGCTVKLWLADGRKDPRRVKYTVATSPAVVVTRDFGG
jgi:hypothetical protein